MAAWLILLKARLLAPQRTAETAEDDEGDGEEMAEALRFQLRRLQAMRQAGEALLGRPQLGQQVFPRGEPSTEDPDVSVTYSCSLTELLRAYARQLQRHEAVAPLRVDPTNLYAVETARRHLEAVLDSLSTWQPLETMLPPAPDSRVAQRSAVASTMAASLELAREGRLDVQQDAPFDPVYVRPLTDSARGEAA
jgi:segregation and condensation protein A